jgi:hypothetical protein
MNPFINRKQGAFFLITSDAYDNFVKQFGRALNEVNVTIGNGVKCARIYDRLHSYIPFPDFL